MNIVITGASSGIGLRTAEKLSVAGHRVFNISRNPANIPHVTDVLADLARGDSIKIAIRRIEEEVGRVDAGIYCAGFAIAGSVRDVENTDVAEITQVNYLSATYFVREMEQAMRHRGRVILLSSLAGMLPLPYQPYYSATKAALIAYARSLAMEWRDTSLSVCCLMPGGVSTPFSRHREKVYGQNDNPNLNSAISRITDIEQGGILADDVADKIIALLERPKMPTLATPSFFTTLTIGAAKLMPAAWTDYFIERKFNQRKKAPPVKPAQPRPVIQPEIIDLTQSDARNPAQVRERDLDAARDQAAGDSPDNRKTARAAVQDRSNETTYTLPPPSSDSSQSTFDRQ